MKKVMVLCCADAGALKLRAISIRDAKRVTRIVPFMSVLPFRRGCPVKSPVIDSSPYFPELEWRSDPLSIP
jgi:hypothetical protein